MIAFIMICTIAIVTATSKYLKHKKTLEFDKNNKEDVELESSIDKKLDYKNYDLDLRRSEIDHNKIEKITNKLLKEKVVMLRYLDLYDNKIRSKGMKKLEVLIKTNPQLLHIDFSYNELGVEGMRHLVTVINLKGHYILLGLDRNYLGDKGLKILVNKMEEMKIDTLRLSRNGITDFSVPLINNLFTKVKELELESNQISEHGIKTMKEYIEKNKEAVITTYIWIKGNIANCSTYGDSIFKC